MVDTCGVVVVQVIGCYGEVIHEIGAPSIKYANVLLPLLQAGLADSMEPVRRNSAFCLGKDSIIGY